MKRIAIVAALALLMPCAAGAQLSTSDASRRGPTITLDGKTVIEPRTMAIAGVKREETSILPEIETVRVGDTGYDLVCVYRNTKSTPQPLARLTIGALTLGPEVQYLNVHRGSTIVDITHKSFTPQAWRYPSEAFSPATVLMNKEVAVGVSLLYPVTEYRHDVLVGVSNAGGVFRGPDGAEGWTVSFDLSQPPYNNPNTALAYPAKLKPGEERTYTVAVRTMKRTRLPRSVTDQQDWLETLLPYREYFQKQFGGVTYKRNPDAVLACEVANVSAMRTDNPRGFLGDKATRPDLNGFGPFMNYIRAKEGFRRVMLWAPSGLYNKNREHNYPPQFTLGWDDIPLLRTTYRQLTRLPRTGIQLGLWWGRATQHASTWDPEKLEPLDLENRDHLRNITQQLSMADRAGSTLIGLDGLNHWLVPAWDQLRLIRAMRRVYPSMTFVAEPMCADFIQVDAPGFMIAYAAKKGARSDRDFHKLKTPHYLADFLMPGHESWAYFRYSEIQRVRPGNISSARVQSDASALAKLGFVPVIVSTVNLSDPDRARAARTWETTVPEHLRQQPEEIRADP
ncbi:MAG: hypothetical protein ACIAQ0_10235 [Phycisphaerales bacterium JB058]